MAATAKDLIDDVTAQTKAMDTAANQLHYLVDNVDEDFSHKPVVETLEGMLQGFRTHMPVVKKVLPLLDAGVKSLGRQLDDKKTEAFLGRLNDTATRLRRDTETLCKVTHTRFDKAEVLVVGITKRIAAMTTEKDKAVNLATQAFARMERVLSDLKATTGIVDTESVPIKRDTARLVALSGPSILDESIGDVDDLVARLAKAVAQHTKLLVAARMMEKNAAQILKDAPSNAMKFHIRKALESALPPFGSTLDVAQAIREAGDKSLEEGRKWAAWRTGFECFRAPVQRAAETVSPAVTGLTTDSVKLDRLQVILKGALGANNPKASEGIASFHKQVKAFQESLVALEPKLVNHERVVAALGKEYPDSGAYTKAAAELVNVKKKVKRLWGEGAAWSMWAEAQLKTLTV